MSGQPGTPATSGVGQEKRQEQPAARHTPRWKRRHDGGMALNLTPMIDVVFLLLFFFLVVTRFGTREGTLPADLPRKTGGASVEIPRTPIRVRFLAEEPGADTCRVTIDKLHDAPLPIEELLPELRRIQAEAPGFDDPETPIHLFAREGIRWDHVVNAYNAGLAARYERIYFVE